MHFRNRSRWSGLQALFGLAAIVLTGCAATPPDRGGIGQLRLFDAAGAPRFSFYYTCAGQVSAETDLCWVPSKYFSSWASDRRFAITELPNDVAFDANLGVPALQRVKADSGADYRIVVRFAPFVTPSYTSENTGMGGFVPPKVGYQAEVFAYAAGDGKLVAQADYHHKSDAPFKADSVPYIKAGVQAVVAALDPSYVVDVDSGNNRAPCTERPGRSAQGCGAPADARN